MRYTGIQPQYFPRLHYIARILNSDIFVVRDDAQFLRKHKYPGGRVDKSYQAHTPIKQAGGIQFLNIPTLHSGFAPIRATRISYTSQWNLDHLRAIELAYAKAPYFSSNIKEIKEILLKKYENLADLNLVTIFWGLVKLLNLDKFDPLDLTLADLNQLLKKQKKFRLKKIERASDSRSLKQKKELSANQKIIALCREFGITEDYCGGTGVAAYVDKEYFSRNGIKITVQDWHCREYPQRFKRTGFIKNLSVIDLFMNVSPVKAVNLLK